MAFRYTEIMDLLLQDIKEMEPHTKLLSRPVLCQKYLTTRTTIDRAISQLIGEGYLYSVGGSGTYVADIRIESNIKSDSTVSNWGVILPNVMSDTYPGILRGIEDFAQSKNINILICNSDNDENKQYSYFVRLVASNVKGLVIIPPAISISGNPNMYSFLINSKVPFVFCNRTVPGVNAPLVASNDFYGGYIATKKLIEKGYKKVCYFSRIMYKTSTDRYQGYIAALNEVGIESDNSLVFLKSSGTPFEAGYNTLNNLIKSGKDFDSVFCFNDAIAEGVIKAIQDNNLRVSDDIGIIGYDNTSICDKMQPRLTSVSYKTYEIGQKVAEVLYKINEGIYTENETLSIFEPSLIERDSCKGKK